MPERNGPSGDGSQQSAQGAAARAPAQEDDAVRGGEAETRDAADEASATVAADAEVEEAAAIAGAEAADAQATHPREPLESAQAEDLGEGYSELTKPAAIAQALESFMRPGACSILFDVGYPEPQPAVLRKAVAGKGLLLDLSAIPEWETRLRDGIPFRVLGQGGRKLLRTPWLRATEVNDESRTLECLTTYPERIEVLQRRGTFRAELRMGMEAWVTISSEGKTWEGRLRNLSQGGCLVYFPLGAAAVFSESTGRPVPMRIRFPRGDVLEIAGYARHQVVVADARELRIGFEFDEAQTRHDRKLWFCVREIEREAARIAATNSDLLEPSDLFQAPAVPTFEPVTDEAEYATSMTRRLAAVTEFIEVQILALREGRNIDGVQLSRMAERLLALLAHDRNEVLFALACLNAERPLVIHSLAVAVRLGDLATSVKMPRATCKAITACGLVHDLGKVLLPKPLLRAQVLSEDQLRELHGHVALLMPHLVDCRWLSPSVVRQVIEQINERMDGTGYPHKLAGDQLHQLARFAMVVDMIDAMQRDRADRGARTIDQIYRVLAAEPERVDKRWLLRFRQYFGVFPIGTLLQFENGGHAWVRALDDRGHPSLVQAAHEPEIPSATNLGELLDREQMRALGPPRKVVLPRQPQGI